MPKSKSRQSFTVQMNERLKQYARQVLDYPFWIDSLERDTEYEWKFDSVDGGGKEMLKICFSKGGEIGIWIEEASHKSAAMRMSEVASLKNPRVCNALMILAYAIMLDNADCSRKK